MHNLVLSPIDTEKLISSISERVTASVLKAVNTQHNDTSNELLTREQTCDLYNRQKICTFATQNNKRKKITLKMDKIDRMLASFENALKSISKDKLDRIINRIDALYSSEQQSVIEYFNSFEEHYEDLYQLSSNVEYSADEFVSSSKSLNIQDNKC